MQMYRSVEGDAQHMHNGESLHNSHVLGYGAQASDRLSMPCVALLSSMLAMSALSLLLLL